MTPRDVPAREGAWTIYRCRDPECDYYGDEPEPVCDDHPGPLERVEVSPSAIAERPVEDGAWVIHVCKCGDFDVSPFVCGGCGPAQPVQVIPLATAERLAELVERHGPRKHNTGCPMHLMHDWFYEDPEANRDEASLPVPRCCECGCDEAREALAAYHQATGSRATEGGTDG